MAKTTSNKKQPAKGKTSTTTDATNQKGSGTTTRADKEQNDPTSFVAKLALNVDAGYHMLAAIVFFALGNPACHPGQHVSIVDVINQPKEASACVMVTYLYAMMRLWMGMCLFLLLSVRSHLSSPQRAFICLGSSVYHALSAFFCVHGVVGHDDPLFDGADQIHGTFATIMMVASISEISLARSQLAASKKKN